METKSKYAEVGEPAWWKYIDVNWDLLSAIIRRYHPSFGRNYSRNITAPAAEAARQDVVSEIEAEGPIDFQKAKEERDAAKIYCILSAAWHGVPETRTCWSIEGFNELCTVLEHGVPNEEAP